MSGLAEFFAHGDPGVVFATLLVLAALALFALYYGYRSLHRAQIIRDTPTSRIATAAQGYVEFTGFARMMKGKPVTAPLSNRHCCWYRFKVSERQHANTDEKRFDPRWGIVERGVSDNLFLIDDGDAQCVIDPEGASVIATKKFVWYGNTRRPEWGPEAGTGGLLATGRYRYEEERIERNDDLYAIGLFTTLNHTAEEGPLQDDIRTILAAWKNDPMKMRQIDANNDGSIDGEEWEQARAEARAEALAARHQRAAEIGTNLMIKPKDRRRPYILSVYAPEQLVRRHYLHSVLGIGGFFLLGGLAVWGAQLAFG